MRTRAQDGLSLIEVIVALVILSSFGAALFVWAAQTLRTASRAAEAEQEAELERNVTALASSINPWQVPEGKFETSTHRYAWNSTLLRGPTDQVRHPQGPSPYQAALYSLHFTVTDLSNPEREWKTEREVAGFGKVRARALPPFATQRLPGG